MTDSLHATLAPPFTLETALLKVRKAEDGWNSRNPAQVALAYSVGSIWRNRSAFLTGREQIIAFLTRKWANELEYRLIKELWAFREIRIAVRFIFFNSGAPIRLRVAAVSGTCNSTKSDVASSSSNSTFFAP